MAQAEGSSWADKGPLERSIIVGIRGTPELHREQKMQFLGEFAERVLASLTKQEVEHWAVDKAVARAAADPRAKLIIVHGEIPFDATMKYRALAKEHGLESIIRLDPSFRGDVGLVVASDEAVR